MLQLAYAFEQATGFGKQRPPNAELALTIGSTASDIFVSLFTTRTRESAKRIRCLLSWMLSAFHDALTRIAHEILEHNRGLSNLALVGVRSRGVPIAQRIADDLRKILRRRGVGRRLDITLYRDT